MRYGFTFWFNMVDLLVVIRMGMLVRAYDPEPGTDPWQAFFASLCTTLAGWMRLGAQFYEFSLIPDVKGRDANWFEIWNYWINITAYIQTATGFVRYAYTKFPGNAPLAVALIAKTAVDTIGDLFSGVSTCAQPGYELANPPKIQIERPPNGQPVMLPVGTTWQPYEMDYITVEGGFPTYSWTTAGTDDPDSPPNGLQDGLYLETADEGAYGAKKVRVAGWLDDIRAVHGQMLMEDNYGPGLTDSFTYYIGANVSPGNLPPSTFTCDRTSGYAPLTVQFQDTVAEPVEWFWDFGDGKTSSDRNPAHVFEVGGRYTVTHRVYSSLGYWGPPRTTEILVEE